MNKSIHVVTVAIVLCFILLRAGAPVNPRSNRTGCESNRQVADGIPMPPPNPPKKTYRAV